MNTSIRTLGLIGLLASSALAQGLDTTLKASDGAPNELGCSVSLSGNRVLVGASSTPLGGSNQGSAYLFDATTGHELHRLLPPVGNFGDGFGTSVALEGDLALVGAAFYEVELDGPDIGAAFLFDADSGALLSTFKDVFGDHHDYFGFSVALSGSRAIIGAPKVDPPPDGSIGGSTGAAFVFDVTTGGLLWKLTASDAKKEDQLGISVAIDGKLAVVGAPYADPNGGHSGTAYVFDMETGEELHKLTASDAAAHRNFGHRVAIEGTRALVIAPNNLTGGEGSAYVFDTTTGAQLYKLGPFEQVGINKVLTASVGSGRAIIGSTGSEARIFDLATGAELGLIHGSTHVGFVPNGDFASSVAIEGDRAVVGASEHNDPGVSEGTAYVFDLSLCAKERDVKLSSGETQSLHISAGEELAGAIYLVLGTSSGTSPGITLDGLNLPLNIADPYFGFTLANPNSATLSDSLGVLDPQGKATASFNAVPGGFPPSAKGLVLNHAYVVLGLNPLVVAFTSNAVSVKLL